MLDFLSFSCFEMCKNEHKMMTNVLSTCFGKVFSLFEFEHLREIVINNTCNCTWHMTITHYIDFKIDCEICVEVVHHN